MSVRCWLVGWLVGWSVSGSVCHDFLKGREVSLPIGALVSFLSKKKAPGSCNDKLFMDCVKATDSEVLLISNEKANNNY